MITTRRGLLAGAAVGAAGMGASAAVANRFVVKPDSPLDQVQPIGVDERLIRISRAQSIMQLQGISAILIEAGSALVYFTGVRWWRSERFTGAIIPAEGDIAFITPNFEEPSVRESMSFGDDVRTWHEHEDPFNLVKSVLTDRGITEGKLGIEATTRYFIVDGVTKSAPNMQIVSADRVTRGCRMYKSPAEISLMQAANDVTMLAYRATYPKIAAGMSNRDIAAIMNAETRKLGGDPQFELILLGEASAYPHGSNQPQEVREGEIVLMDCGCAVHDYESDISRTFVFGEPTKEQRKVWRTVKEGQERALEAAQIGVAAGRVDEIVRGYYERKGYGPGYQAPGLTHRLGHGIGMDGHEPVNFVGGETTVLAPGMCFSNEPGIYLPGKFGVRLEDCLYMTEDGPQLFSDLSPSIDKPFG